jgi:hypothetical protein
LLKLEDVYDVTVAKDGQEAFDTVKAAMNEGKRFDLIFMDIQVCAFLVPLIFPAYIDSEQDAQPRRSPKHAPDSANGLLRPHRRSERLRGREQHQGLYGIGDEYVLEVYSLKGPSHE